MAGTCERATFWRDPQLAGVELLHARFVTHSFLPHQHDAYAIGVIEAGAEAFRYRGERQVAPAGSVVVIHPGEAHTGSAAVDAGWHYRMLYPDPAWLKEAAGWAELPFFPAPVLHDDHLAALLRAAHAAFTNGAGALERETRLRAALSHLARAHANGRAPSSAAPDHAALARARDFLDAHPDTNVTLSELSAVVGVSPYHLARRFRDAFGVPPHAYQLGARVRRARQLLASGTPIAQAALEAGFADQAHLTRAFKRVVGVPPGRFVAGLRG